MFSHGRIIATFFTEIKYSVPHFLFEKPLFLVLLHSTTILWVGVVVVFPELIFTCLRKHAHDISGCLNAFLVSLKSLKVCSRIFTHFFFSMSVSIFSRTYSSIAPKFDQLYSWIFLKLLLNLHFEFSLFFYENALIYSRCSRNFNATFIFQLCPIACLENVKIYLDHPLVFFLFFSQITSVAIEVIIYNLFPRKRF